MKNTKPTKKRKGKKREREREREILKGTLRITTRGVGGGGVDEKYRKLL